MRSKHNERRTKHSETCRKAHAAELAGFEARGENRAQRAARREAEAKARAKKAQIEEAQA